MVAPVSYVWKLVCHLGERLVFIYLMTVILCILFVCSSTAYFFSHGLPFVAFASPSSPLLGLAVAIVVYTVGLYWLLQIKHIGFKFVLEIPH